ncbi:hypothetical protein GDO86_002026 [Hymenochirus boettgeri]|uniref:Arginine/serine-rich coiled-coil protein 2 n=1 Tax=Hymenochirus boettgeri TaxID=247094 RepID=A0A8T2KG69_9PIPI|nr:hypothetical protein GDO86_002026 [Hymenochirus boettgeri]
MGAHLKNIHLLMKSTWNIVIYQNPQGLQNIIQDDCKKHKSRSRSKEARRHEVREKSKKHRPDSAERDHSEKMRERQSSSENGEERHKHKSKGKSYSRSRSRERRHRSKSRDKKKSRSKSREKRRRPRSRSSSRSKHRHRSRSRSRSREKKKRIEKPRRHSRSRSRTPPSPPAFRGRNTAMDAQEALARRLERAKKLQEQREKEMVEKQKHQEIAAAGGGSVINVAALLASGTQVTPQIAMAAQMAALQAKALAETGISVPSYYNPAAVNPMRFAEQEKKRKMLWQGKKEGDKSQSAELWEKLNFGNKDQNVKFRKLMGIKNEEEAGTSTVTTESFKTMKQQEEVFRNLDAQYEMARSQTHTQRGMGLGFTSSMRGMDAV